MYTLQGIYLKTMHGHICMDNLSIYVAVYCPILCVSLSISISMYTNKLVPFLFEPLVATVHLGSHCSFCRMRFNFLAGYEFAIFVDLAFLNLWLLAIAPCVSIDVLTFADKCFGDVC